MTIGANLAYIAQRTPNKPAIYYKNAIITYQEFYQEVQTYKRKLHSLQPNKQGLRIGIHLSNEPRFLYLFFATISLGWTAVPIDPKWKEREINHMIKEIEPTIIITTKKFFKGDNCSPPFYAIEQLDKQNEVSQIHNHVIQKEDPFYIGFTSGSTGTPKGFIRNHDSWLASFSVAEEVFQYGADDTIMAPGPLCHSLSLFAAIHALHIGAGFYLMGTYSPSLTYHLIKEAQITVLYAVPTMLYRLGNKQNRSNESILFLSSGAALLQQTKENLKKFFPCSTIIEYYGASELSFITYATEEMKQIDPFSVGKPFPGVTINICDNVERKVSNKTVGQLYVQSDFLFSSYVNNSNRTKEIFTTNGVTVGDLGFINKRGFLTIIGRQDNMMIVGGQNVFPEEVEHVLKSSGNVIDAVIIGLKDVHWGYRLVAFVQSRQADPEEVKKLKALCKARLPIHKRPRRYIFIDAIPYTRTGKIAREEIEKNSKRWIK